MKTGLHFLTLAIVFGCIAFSSCGQQARQEANKQPFDTLPTLILQVQRCSRLYTAEFRIHKIVTHDDVVRLRGNLMKKDFDFELPVGQRKIAIPMDAVLKAYINFSTFSASHIERDGDRITLVLPDPQVMLTSSKVNQHEIREYVGLTRAHFSDKEMADYERQGRQAIIESVPALGIVEMARENAARILVPMLTELGYREENITIAFRKDLNVKTLINADIES